MSKNYCLLRIALLIILVGVAPLVLRAQDLLVSGKVTENDSGASIPGVNIVVKGTGQGTVTNYEGNYSINVPENAILVFSSVGYVTEEIQVNNQTKIDVSLVTDITALSEIVVVGYGTQKSESITGAISSVSSKEIAALPVPSIESALQGRVPGVSVVNNGSPGTAPIVRIRGIGSISYAANPLYVVDGIVVQGGLNNFDTKDIASVDVLKDASAAAIYGSRAANGVIMISTKKGSDSGLHVDLNSYVGVQQAWKKLDLLNTDQYLTYAKTLLDNAGTDYPDRFSNMNTPIYEGADQTYAETNTDWQDEMFRNATIAQTHLSLSGGNDISKFYSSLGYFTQEGIMLGTEYERVNFRLNSDHKLSDRFTVGQNLLIAYDDRFNEMISGGRTQIKHMLHSIPYIPVHDPTQDGGFRASTAEDASNAENPVRIATMDKSNTQSFRMLTNAYLDYKLFDGLSYRFNVGIDYGLARQNITLPIYSDGFRSRPQKQLQKTHTITFSPTYTNQLTFDKSFGKNHINVIAVVESQNTTIDMLYGGGAFNSNANQELAGALNAVTSSTRNAFRLISYIGRVNYEFAGKYLLSASIRRDGSSVFAPGKKWGNFPAASVGWRISEEPFMKNLEAVSELKIRASYGLVGFNGIGAYDWQVIINSNTAAIIGGSEATGSYFDKLGNTELEWETTKMWNAGLDLGLFDNSLTFSMEVYNRDVDNLILQVPTPPSLGYAQSTTSNIGEMKNWGAEFQLGYGKATGDFTYNITGNIGFTRNEVVKLATPSSTLTAGQIADYGDNITRTEEGHPIQSFYGYVVDGIFQSEDEVFSSPSQNLPDDLADYDPSKYTGPGDIRFKDLNNDGLINADDQQYLGSYLPDFNYGLNFSANYKNFDLTLFVQGVQGSEIYNLTKFYTQATPRLFGAGVEVLDGWTPGHTNTDIPRMIDVDPNRNARVSDRFIEDGSYLRIKNLSLGYNFSENALQSFTNGKMRKLRIYVSSQNLLTLTGYSGYDPEVGSWNNNLLTGGIDYGQFPSARTFMAGLQLGF